MYVSRNIAGSTRNTLSLYFAFVRFASIFALIPSLSNVRNSEHHKLHSRLNYCPFRYGIAVALEHVPAFLPYISDTGVRVPERSVFSQLVNFSAFFHFVTVYVRFEQVRAEIKYRWNEERFRGR